MRSENARAPRVLVSIPAAAAATLFAMLAPMPVATPPAGAAEPNPLAQLDAALQAAAAFEYGKDAGPLELVEREIAAALGKSERRAAVEERLLVALSSAKTRDAKDFLCRQLRTIGTVRSVGALEAMLLDPDLSHLSRYALERIEDPAADAALLRALERSSGEIRVGILGTLGRRRSAQALPEAAKLLSSPEEAVASAAAGALGQIAGADAVKALEAARPEAPEALRVDIDDALLACAERLLAGGQKAEAARIYEVFHALGQPRHLRIGALRGLVAARGADVVNLVVEALKDPDPEIRSSAVDATRCLQGGAAANALAALVPSLPPDGQQLLLRALGSREDAAGSAEVTSAVVAATKSASEGVRLAAYEALGSLGLPSHVDLLLAVAATAGGAEQQAARAGLVRLKDGQADAPLVRAISSGDPRVRVEALRALSGRRARAAFGEILKATQDGDASVRSEAIAALGAFAGEADLPALLALAVKPREGADRPAVESAAAAALRRVADPEKRAGAVLAALASASAEAKPALLRLLAKAPTPAALEAVRGALKDGDAAVREAALGVLAGWPDATPAEDLLELARNLSEAAGKEAALRGYVHMAGLSKDPAAMYAHALDLAARPEDRKLVLAGLGAAGSTAALDLVEKCLKDSDEQVRAAAGLAAAQIADRLRQSDASRAKATVRKVLESVADAGARQRAQEVLNEFDKYEGYILLWSISGPYREKGKESRAAFDAVFPPEGAEGNEVAWKRFRRGVGAWDVNLEAALDPLSHAAAYVRTRVSSPEDRDARLELGSDDAVKVWLNGKLVHENYTHRGLGPKQDLVNVKLQKGWNDLMLKVVNHDGPWGFCCRMRKPDGTAMDGLKVEAR